MKPCKQVGRLVESTSEVELVFCVTLNVIYRDRIVFNDRKLDTLKIAKSKEKKREKEIEKWRIMSCSL